MNLRPAKNFVKKYFPDLLLRTTKYAYYVLSGVLFVSRINKYLPYYQDELSREVLSARINYLKTGDLNIFLDLAEKSGIMFKNPEGITTEITNIVIIYDKDGKNFKYACRVLEMCGWSGKYRTLTLEDFLNGGNISAGELVYFVLTKGGLKRFDSFIKKKNNDVKFTLLRGAPYAVRNDLQYFDVFTPDDDEIIVDCGAYDGSTALQFLEWGRGKVKKVYSFEFDPVNASRCEENLKDYGDKVTLIKKGTWDRDEIFYVKTLGTGSSSINTEGDTEVHLTAIDNIVKDKKVTFIKMDVEGAELKSLQGAKNTIKKNHPRLAICVYHTREDLYEIPEYILSLVPEYKFYLRHYSSRDWETVLYAFC